MDQTHPAKLARQVDFSRGGVDGLVSHRKKHSHNVLPDWRFVLVGWSGFTDALKAAKLRAINDFAVNLIAWWLLKNVRADEKLSAFLELESAVQYRKLGARTESPSRTVDL